MCKHGLYLQSLLLPITIDYENLLNPNYDSLRLLDKKV